MEKILSGEKIQSKFSYTQALNPSAWFLLSFQLLHYHLPPSSYTYLYISFLGKKSISNNFDWHARAEIYYFLFKKDVESLMYLFTFLAFFYTRKKKNVFETKIFIFVHIFFIVYYSFCKTTLEPGLGTRTSTREKILEYDNFHFPTSPPPLPHPS